MFRRGMLGLSADPLTYGHIDLIERASKLFDELHVVILENSNKKYLFSLQERESIVKSIIEQSGIPNLVVAGWSRLLYMYAYLHKIGYIVRGMRGEKDFSWELQLEDTLRLNNISLEFVYLHAKIPYRHISSSWVKSMVQERASVHNMVPSFVKKELEKRILWQVTVGVTGSKGVGKSTVIKRLIEKIEMQGGQAHHIDFDSIVHRIYDSGVAGLYREYLEKIILLLPDFCVDRKNLIIHREEIRTFLRRIGIQRAKNLLEEIGKILQIPIENEFQIQRRGKKGILFIESAILLERNSAHICNGDIIMVDANKETLLNRFDTEDVLHFVSGTIVEKLAKYEQLPNYQRGQLWKINTSDVIDPSVEKQINEVVTHFQNIFAF